MFRSGIRNDLRDSFKNNPLFKEEIIGAPPDFVSVYHFTHENFLNNIAEGGILPSAEILKNAEGLNFKVDKIFDNAAPKGWSRTNSVYAHSDYHFVPHLGNGNVVLEIRVDPKNVLVADAEHFIVARLCYEKRRTTSGLEYKYWANTLPLENFSKLSVEERVKMIHLPEILIPGRVEPKFVKIKGVFL